MKVENPSIEEIKNWAYSDEDIPDVEWPLFLSWKEDVKTWIKLATDHKCPKKKFFLFMLYYQVGTQFGASYRIETEFVVNGYLQCAKGVKHGDIRKWKSAVEHLLKKPESYTYEDWRGGELIGYTHT